MVFSIYVAGHLISNLSNLDYISRNNVSSLKITPGFKGGQKFNKKLKKENKIVVFKVGI